MPVMRNRTRVKQGYRDSQDVGVMVMSEYVHVTKCRDAEQDKRIEGLLKRNRRISEIVQKQVLGHNTSLLDGDLIEDALQSHLGTMHNLERILKEKGG